MPASNLDDFDDETEENMELTNEDVAEILQFNIDQVEKDLEEHKEMYQSDKGAFVHEREQIKARLDKLEEVCMQQQSNPILNDLPESETIQMRNISVFQEITEIKKQVAALKSDNEESKLLLVSLQKKVEDLKEKLSNGMQEQKVLITTLQSQVKDLTDKLSNSEKSTDKLYLCQAALLFEQAVCISVLPKVFTGDNFASIKSLLNYLNGDHPLPLDPEKDDIDDVLQKAKCKWNKICEALRLPEEWKRKKGKWKSSDRRVPKVLRAMDLLKQARVPVAHPNPIKVSEAERVIKSDAIKTGMPPWQYEIIDEFICSLRSNMEHCQLQHRGLKLD